MTFFVLSDDAFDARVVDAVRNRVGVDGAGIGVLAHASGRPCVIGDARAGAHHDIRVDQRLDQPAGGGCVSIRGTLSTSHHVFWSRVGGGVVASDSARALRDVVGAPLDVERVALALCPNVPGHPLRLTPYWQGVEAAAPGETVTLAPGGHVRRSRGWHVDELPHVDLETAGDLVREALEAAITRAVGRGGHVGCDVSGGVDSTSIAYLLDARDRDVTYLRASTDDAANADAHWARRAAQDLRGELVELPSFTSTAGAFDPDLEHAGVEALDGPPAWGAHLGHLERLFTELRRRSARVHLNGLGGDELFSAMPSAVTTLRRHDPAASRRALGRLVRSQRWPAVRTWRAAYERTSFEDEVRRRARVVARADGGPDDAFAWAPGFGASRFATAAARDAVVAFPDRGPAGYGASSEASVEASVEALIEDRGLHQILDAVVFQGEVTRQVNAVFAHTGIEWCAPMLDERLVVLVLGLPVRVRAAAGEVHKPLLASATRGVVPREVFTRRDKGDYTDDLVRELSARRGAVRRMFDESVLVDTGLVDPVEVRRALDAPLSHVGQAFELEHLVGLERWLRSVA